VRRAPTLLWLTALWVVLWRDLSWANVLSGMVVAAAVEVAQPPTVGRRARHGVRVPALLSLIGYFTWKLVEANIVMAREVVTPRNRIEAGVIEVALPPTSDLIVTLVANAVSLTPGTLTLEVRQLATPTLYVHVLHLHDIDRARTEVLELARRAEAALPVRERAA
jgi:multicomponent Na+:H+ antiporter subunit E